jgi:hypothetical protein
MSSKHRPDEKTLHRENSEEAPHAMDNTEFVRHASKKTTPTLHQENSEDAPHAMDNTDPARRAGTVKVELVDDVNDNRAIIIRVSRRTHRLLRMRVASEDTSIQKWVENLITRALS